MDTLVPKENSKDLHPADPMADERAEGQASAETSGSGGRTKAEKTHPDGEAATGAAKDTAAPRHAMPAPSAKTEPAKTTPPKAKSATKEAGSPAMATTDDGRTPEHAAAATGRPAEMAAEQTMKGHGNTREAGQQRAETNGSPSAEDFQTAVPIRIDPATQNRNILRKAAMDVHLLVAHLARSGGPTDAKEDEDAPGLPFEEIIGLARDAETDKLTEKTEAEFWLGYRKLVCLARPARVDSLYYEYYARSLGLTEKSGGRRSVLADYLSLLFRRGHACSPIETHMRIIRWLQIIAIVTFVVTIYLAAYIGTTEKLLSATERHILLYDAISVDRIPADLAPAWLAAGGRSLGTTDAQGAASEVVATDEYLAAWRKFRKEDIKEAVLRNDHALDWWNWFESLDAAPEAAAPAEADGKLAAAQMKPKEIATDKPLVVYPPAFRDNVVRASQREINSILTGYFMPLLASILGVCVFILRDSARKFAELSFAAREVPSYWPRIILGIVGGLVIGWFVDSMQLQPSAGAPPAVIAFIVGYSTDVFFTVIDAVVGRFTRPQSPANASG